MKKTIIITAIIFAVSAILTVCLAVALGANGINELLFDDNAVQRIEEIGERLDGIGDRIDNSFDIDSEDQSNLVNEEKAAISDASDDTAVIGCDAAEITVVPSTDGVLYAVLKEYSYIKSDNAKYHIETNKNGYDIYISRAQKSGRNIAKAVVFVPESIKNLKIDAKAAEIDIKNMNLNNIDVKVDAGEVDFENTTAEICNVRVNAGEVKLENNFKAKKSVTVSVDTGDIVYELPLSSKAVIDYEIDMGTVDVEDGLMGYKAFDKNGNTVTVPKKSGRLESADGTDGAVKVSLKVDAGNIEFEQIVE